MKRKWGLLAIERAYPYVLAALSSWALYKLDFNVLNSKNVDSLIDGLVTMESIVIGLIGAIIPVVLSMKNESKFVKYVFENDTNMLFRKYLTATIGIGLLSLVFSLAMYIRDQYTDKVCNVIYYAWIFLVFLFLLSTYRSMKYMILIIFTSDETEEADELTISQDERKGLRDKYNRNS